MQQAAPVKSKLEVFDILKKLESLTDSATKLPLTNRAVLNPADLNELIGALKRVLPAEVTEAQQIIRFKESILGQAHNEAKRIRATAEEESLNKVSETQVSRDSKVMAERLVAEARPPPASGRRRGPRPGRRHSKPASAGGRRVRSRRPWQT